MANIKGEDSLQEFQRKVNSLREQLEKLELPEALAGSKSSELLTQSAEALADVDTVLGINESLASMYADEGEDVEEAFASIRQELGVRDRV